MVIFLFATTLVCVQESSNTEASAKYGLNCSVDFI